MAKIKQLSPHEAQKIAAGQVIDRPANVVKELIENALDANASRIAIHVEDGGKQLIRVVDNGYGMDKEDAIACLQKHATSKIRSVDELISISSYGFRGEALASIAAVSKLTLCTKEADSTEGIKVHNNDDKISCEPTACPEGTDITIANLFYNMPARAKFLKKRETETRHIIQLLQAMSLTYPSHHFQLFVDGNPHLNCPPQETLLGRCAQLWGQQTARHILTVEPNDYKGVSISGIVSNHTWFRYDRRTIFFLVNNRWVTNPSLGRALLNGYSNVLPHGRYPTACISIQIDPAEIDINTHPKKEEVMFAHPRIVEQLIAKAVRATLEQGVSKQIKRDVSFATSHTEYIPPPYNATPFSSFTPPPQQTNTAPIIQIPHNEEPLPIIQATPPSQTEITASQHNQSISNEQNTESYTMVGQFHKTYILIEQEKGLYLIDQHAAHERIMYELFLKRFQDIPTINLMFPPLIACSTDDLALLEPHLHIFHDHGIQIEPFGKEQLIVQATPVHLKNCSFDDLIKQVIGWISEYRHVDQEQFLKKIHDKLRAQMACKAAVKAGDSLTQEQMRTLIDDLATCPNRFSCPHGRPTGWLFSFHDIEKRFRRT